MSEKNYTIAPSILGADFGCLKSEIEKIEECGAKWLHIDVMDGSFVTPISFGTNMVELAKRYSSMFLDVHLMVSNPEKQIPNFLKVGSNAITFHYEATNDPRKLLTIITDNGVTSGLAINPETPIEKAFEFLDITDLILIMSVSPGYGGQKFKEETLNKIAALRNEIDKRKLSTQISVDGGINNVTAAKARACGANILVAGNSIFKATNIKKAFEEI